MFEHNFTIEELEREVFDSSKCYKDSTAFQRALEYIKKTNLPLYKDLLYKEVVEMGWNDLARDIEIVPINVEPEE